MFRRNPMYGSLGNNNLIDVRIITELESDPIVNDLIEETFSTPLGY